MPSEPKTRMNQPLSATKMKQNLLFLFMIALAIKGSAQSSTFCETSSCATPTSYYLDIDGDGYGVDNPETNLSCCAKPDMYASLAGDLFPFYGNRVFATSSQDSLSLSHGCTVDGACNYDASAILENGTCVFPLSCQTCDPITGGIAADGTGQIPCDCDEKAPYGPLYLDALNTCGGACTGDSDFDGICDNDSDGDGHDDDKCIGFGGVNIVDQCNSCQPNSTSGSWYYIVGTTTPCVPGDMNCTLGGVAGAACNCDGEVLNNCNMCLANDIDITRYDCSGNCYNTDNLTYQLPNDTTNYMLCDYLRVEGCRDESKCNYDPEANFGDQTQLCLTLDPICGECGGSGIVTGACDCEGNVEDALGVCGGTCPSDANNNDICDNAEIVGCSDASACNYNSEVNVADDSVCIYKDSLDVCGGTCFYDVDNDDTCDDVDDCVGLYDACGTCVADSAAGNWFTLANGITPCEPGTEDCYLDVALNQCDCDGYTYDVLKICGGLCQNNADGDDLCDDDLDGDGFPDDPDICSSQRDSLGVCGGNCWSDGDGDYLCDHDTNGDGIPEDPCLNDPDNNRNECNVCLNDPAALVLPAGSCNCAGDTLDAVDVCGGSCTTDADNDGICDDDLDGDGNPDDTCLGIIDDCGDCAADSTQGNWFTMPDGTPCDAGSPGCTNSLGHCDCEGSTLDSLFICGGTCFQDADHDLICDFDGDCPGGDADDDGLCDADTTIARVDACIGVMDECGVCNGNGANYECGCLPKPAGDCDCEGNVEDECGDCGGVGSAFGWNCDGTCIDLDQDGECDYDVLLEIPRVLLPSQSIANGKVSLSQYLDHLRLMEVLDTMSVIHDRMSENLDDGSLSGHTRNMTIENSIVSRGSLFVGERARFEKLLVVGGDMTIASKAAIAGSATIQGVTFSEGTVITTSMELLGDADVSGDMNVADELKIDGPSALKNGVDVADDLVAYDGQGAGATATIEVNSVTGDVNALRLATDKKFEVAGSTNLDHVKVDNVWTLTNAAVDSQIVVDNDMHLLGSLFVGNSNVVDTIMTVNSSNGNTFIGTDLDIAGDFTVQDSVHVMGDIRIKGSTFAKGGLETSNIRAGYLYVDGNANLKGELSAGNTASWHGTVDLYRNLNMRQLRTGHTTLSASSDSLIFKVWRQSGDMRTWNGSIAAPRIKTDTTTTANRVYVGNRLNVRSYATFNSAVDIHGRATFSGPAVFNSQLRIDKSIRTIGEVNLGGGLITDSLFVTGGAPTINGALEVVSTGVKSTPVLDVDVNLNDGFAAEFINTDGGDGIKLKSGRVDPKNATNFMEFKNAQGVVIGRIEAENIGELNNNKSHENAVRELETALVMAGIDQASSLIGLYLAGKDLSDAISDAAEEGSTTVCAGSGFCTTVPIPSMLIAAAAGIVSAGVGFYQAELAVADAAFGLDAAVKSKKAYDAARDADMVNTGGRRRGITYASGAGDYAEWLPKRNPGYDFMPGQIVGVKRGEISLKTSDADHLFVISTLPIVLGNSPDDESRYEKCAFMGQVQAQVLGQVESGDYIVTSGHDEGFGVAVSEAELDAEMLPRVVGRAWEDGNSHSVNLVNISVGLDRGIARNLAKIESEIAKMERVSKGMKEITESLAKDEKPSLLALQNAGILGVPIGSAGEESTVESGKPIGYEVPENTSVAFFNLNNVGMELAFDEAMEQMNSGDEDDHLRQFMTDMETHPELKKAFLDGLQSKINAHNRKTLREWHNWGFDTGPLEPLTTNVSTQQGK